MKLLIILDKTFANEYYLKYYDVIYSTAMSIKHLFSSDIKIIEKDEIKTDSLLEYTNYLYDISKDYTDILYLRADAPMINIEETRKLVEAHNNALAYYTYGENYPDGIVPFILRVSAFERLIKVLENSSVEISHSFDFIKQAVFTDPNFFEVEVIISEFDMRYYRLSFFADSKRNSVLIDNFIKNVDYKELVNSIKANHNLRRTLPAYFEIDITNQNNAELVNSPVANSKTLDVMSIEKFKKLYEDVKAFTDDFHLSIGSLYEPMLNDNWYSILEYSLEYKNANIYFESNAILLNEENAKKLLYLQERYNNLHVIFHLHAVEVSPYSKIYLNNNLKTTLENLEYYLLRKTKNVHMYIVKQKDNFDYLSNYYKYFEKYKVNIIMQKYSTFKGTLADNRVGNMEPLVFVGCTHLLRDLYIDCNGNVPLCKYDNKREVLLGNIFESGIENIWNNGFGYYKKNVDREIAFCKSCDDWYLYNF